jgi:diguanylate cyclase (GGDEF)-like protein
MQNDTSRDSLTHVWNRESILELLSRELARCKSFGTNLTVILAALDHVKDVNDEPGGTQTNLAVDEIAQRLSNSVRSYDHVSRYGPYQFLVLVPGWEPSQAIVLTEKLKVTVTEPPIDISGSRMRATMSMVVATAVNFKLQDQQEVLRQMEMVLDKQQASGGNRVESLSTTSVPTPRVPTKRRRIRISWVLAGMLGVGIVAMLLLAPSWTCAPNLVGDIFDSSELPPPLPANCVLTSERAADAIIQSIEKQRQEMGLELQSTVTCKIASSHSRRSGAAQDQWLSSLYDGGKLQHRRQVLITAWQDVPGGKLLTIEQCLMPWWKYLKQSEQYCRTQDPSWE